MAAALSLATLPIFFEIYRDEAFNTVRRDDYAPYLLFLAGKGGALPPSPRGYRILSVAVAVPFYYVLPLYVFTNASEIDVPHLKATQALSMASYLCILLTSFFVYATARHRYRASTLASFVVALLAVFLSDFVDKAGIGPIAVALVSILVYYQDDPRVFVPLVLLSPAVNEKVPIIFASTMVARFAFASCRALRRLSRGASRGQLLSAVASLALYFVAHAYLRLPGHEEQTSLQAFLPSAMATIRYTLSLKGFVLNLVPIIILAVIALLAVLQSHDGPPGSRGYPMVADVSAFLVLLMLGLVTSLAYTAGRVVMYSFPLYLSAASLFIDREAASADERSPSPERRRPLEGARG
jgi:hypothetical protein